MTIHYRADILRPLCWGHEVRAIAIMMDTDVDVVTCVDCLRILAKRSTNA